MSGFDLVIRPHLHLDKVYTLGLLDEAALRAYHGAGMARAQDAIDLASRVKDGYDRRRMLPNVRRAPMLVDDAGDASLRTTEMLARATLRAGWQGRVVAHHARAMARYDRETLHRTIALLAEARVAVVTDPHTGPLHAPVRELAAAGVTVCLGQDDFSDAYYPYGRHNMLEVAFLASHLLWLNRRGGTRTGV